LLTAVLDMDNVTTVEINLVDEEKNYVTNYKRTQNTKNKKQQRFV
jgi:hypothetical protein